MSRPGLLLALLLLLAALAGWGLVCLHEQNTARPGKRATPEPAAEAGAGTGSDAETTGSNPPPPPLAQAAEGAGGALESQLLNAAYQISKTRSLSFLEALEFRPGSPDELDAAWRAEMDVLLPEEALQGLGLTLQTLGILPPDEDLAARYWGRPHPSPEVIYDPLEGRLLHTPTLSPAEGEDREATALQLVLMLLDQNFRWHEEWVPFEVNMDRALAQRAFVMGDAIGTTLRFIETDMAASRIWRQAGALTEDWPAVLQAVEFLPLREGVHFSQMMAAENVTLDSIYQRLPATTAHLLHPERFLEIPRWTPREVQWAQLDLLDSEPVWENVIGEQILSAWLKSALPAEDAASLAARWEGDGVLLYQTDDQAPQLVWKIAWRTPEAGSAFFGHLGRHAGALFGVEGGPFYTVDNRLTIEGVLGLEATMQEGSVTIVRTTRPEWREALLDLASRSAFSEAP